MPTTPGTHENAGNVVFGSGPAAAHARQHNDSRSLTGGKKSSPEGRSSFVGILNMVQPGSKPRVRWHAKDGDCGFRWCRTSSSVAISRPDHNQRRSGIRRRPGKTSGHLGASGLCRTGKSPLPKRTLPAFPRAPGVVGVPTVRSARRCNRECC